jgi:hypothetical protein
MQYETKRSPLLDSYFFISAKIIPQHLAAVKAFTTNKCCSPPFNVTTQVIQKVFCTLASSNLHSKKTFSVTWLKYLYIAERSARTNFFLSLYRKIKNIVPLTQKKYHRAVRSKKKEQYTHRINSNLPGESIARGRERLLLFVNKGKSPLFYKKQYKR